MSVSTASICECAGCGEFKPVVAFATFRTRSGESRRRGVCKKCRGLYAFENSERLREYRKEYNKRTVSSRQQKQNDRRRIVKKFVDDYKTSKPCSDCKKKFSAVAMDFDHVRGGKNKGIASLVSGSYKLELIEEEIAKCDLVCACCHRIRTAARRENVAESGPRKPPADRLAVYPDKQSLSKTKHVTFNGETHSVAEWARRLGMNSQVIRYRLRSGYPIESVFSSVAYNFKSSPIRAPRRSSEAHSKKITPQIARLIRTDRKRGMAQQRIADKYGVGQSTVSAIVSGRMWP